MCVCLFFLLWETSHIEIITRAYIRTHSIWSFIVADGFFFLELFVYQTTTIYTTLSPFAVANISILWMYIERPAKKCVAQSSKKE
jgi:hypothetical protein